jgi:hypothetical protein
MRKGISSLIVGVASTLAVPAWSADSPTERGWFVEAGVLETESAGGEAPFTFAGEDTGFTLGGGYTFTKHLGLQAVYYDAGRHAATDCPAPLCTAIPHDLTPDVRALSVAALGTWRVAPALEIFGKVGVLGSKAELDAPAADESDSGALVGAGLGIWATPRFRINLQYERSDHDLELESAGVGVTYRF